MDEALQRLFSACYHNTGFPGQLPQHANDPPSTNDILKGLGLIPPEFDDETIDPSMRSTTTTTHFSSNIASERSISPVCEPRVVQSPPCLLPSLGQDDSPPSRSSSRLNQPSSLPSAPSVSHSLALPPPSPPLDIQAQVRRMTSVSNSRPAVTTREASQTASEVHDNPVKLLNMENFIDLTLCAMPMNSVDPLSDPTLFTMPDNMPDFGYSPLACDPLSQPVLATDSFLAPWPGSLATAHHGMSTAQ